MGGRWLFKTVYFRAWAENYIRFRDSNEIQPKLGVCVHMTMLCSKFFNSFVHSDYAKTDYAQGE